MDTKIKSSDISAIHVLKNVNLDDALAILGNCPVISLSKGQVLLAKGHSNQNLYFLLSGKLAVFLEYPAPDPLAVLETGGTVGELSVIDDSPVSAFVVASEDAKVIEVNETAFWQLTTESHSFACNMLLLLSSRMRSSDDLILKNIHLRKRFEKDAMIDSLTGFHNRRWLDFELPQFIKKYQRDRMSLSILMFDVDHFKKFNDKYGHDAGDAVLSQVSKTTRASLRLTDFCARFGGEEFVVILAGIKKDFACKIAERLRNAIATQKTTTQDMEELPPVTVSIGIAALRDNDTAETLLKRTDLAMYEAKEKGRNRVCQENKS